MRRFRLESSVSVGLARGRPVRQLEWRRCRGEKREGKVTESRANGVFEAVRSGDVAEVAARLQADPSLIEGRGAAGETLLHLAAETDDVAMAEALLQRGVDTAAEASWGQTAFEWAANLGSASVAALLRRWGPTRESLWTAAALGEVEEVRAALGRSDPGRPVRADADLSGWPEQTAFRRGDALSDACYIASRNGHPAVVELLLERGADPNVRGYFGAPALHWAAMGGHARVVELLLSSGAERSVRDPRFDSDAAGWAREGGHRELAERLAADEGTR
jgi:hypothetical protein